MSDCCFSSSPNWYCPKILDFDVESGLFAFGSRNSVVLFTITVPIKELDASRSVQFAGVLRFHSDRVSCLSFPSNSPPSQDDVSSCSPLYLASVGDDLNVNVIDVNTKTLAFQHQEHKARISSVCWSSLSGISKWVVSGDEKGIMILFSLTTNKIKRHVPNKTGGSISVLSCSPHSANIVAVGYLGGLILILDLQNDAKVLHRLSHHDGDIQSLSWAPNKGSLRVKRKQECSESDGTRENGDWRNGGASGDEDHLLASGSKDRTIKIWSTKDGVPIRTLHVPLNVGAGRKKTNDDNTRSHAWVTVTWRNLDNLLTNSHFGELLSWNLNDTGKQPWTVLGQKEAKGHSRTIFNVVNNSTLACTVSLDRQICFWDMSFKEARCLLSMPTLGGFVYGLTFSPVNSGYLAIGCGDNMIRTWNMTTANNPYDVQKFWQGIKSKVTTLAWHPCKEGLLGFGTDEGRVGVYDVLTSKPPLLSMNFHRKVVYTVAWGPMCQQKVRERDFRLYSCGDGNILLHNSKEMEKPASNLNKLISSANPSDSKHPSRSDVSFNPDFSIMIIGNEDGNVELYEPESLKLCIVISGLRKLVQSIRWHPKYTLSSTVESKCSFWLAVASRDVTVRVYDLREHFDKEVTVKLSVPSFELVGHSASVAALSWNPHLDGQLVSASFDGTVRVWDVFKMEVTACYCGHIGRVLCATWNPLNPGQIFSGGEDFTVRLWNVSEQEKEPKTLPVATKGSLRKVRPPKEATSDVMEQLEKLLEQRKEELLNEVLTEGITSNETKKSNVAEEAKSKTGKKSETATKKKKKTYKSMFPISNSKDNCGKSSLLSDCNLLADRLAGDVKVDMQFGSGDLISLGAFGSRLDAYRLLKSEAENHAKGDNHDYELHLGIWKGNVQEVLRNAAKKEQLSDWLVAMAPIVSPSFWEEMSYLYAKQLETDGQPHKAVSYLLANHKVYEAIDVLKKHVSYREAIILAKVRLTPSDPLIVELTEEWAERLVQEGNAEQAAKCYLSIGEGDKAAAILSQRQEPASLRVAAYIVMKIGDLASAFTYTSRAAYESLVRQEDETFDQLIREHPKLKPFLIVSVSHKLLSESAARDVVSNICKWRKPEVDLMIAMKDEWFKCSKSGLFSLHVDFIDECLVCLTQDAFVPHTYKPPQILAFVAMKLTLGLLYALKQQYVNSLEVIHSLLMVIQRHCDQSLVRWLFEFIFPLPGGMSNFFEHVDPFNGLSVWLELMEGSDSHRRFTSLCGSIDAYSALTRLHVLLTEERHRSVLSDTDLVKSEGSEVDDHVVLSLQEMITKLMDSEQAEHSRLSTRLEYIRMAIATLNAKQRWGMVPGHAADNVVSTAVPCDLSQILADQILDHPDVTLDLLEMEAQNVEEQLESVKKKLVVEQFPDPYESCSLLAECCSCVAKRNLEPRVTELLKSVVMFGTKYSALSKHKMRLEQFIQGTQTV